MTDLCWALASFGFTPTDAWVQQLELEIAGRCCVEGAQPPEGVSEAEPVSPASGSGSAGTLQTERLGDQGRLLEGYAANPDSSGAGSRMLTAQQLAVVLWALQSFKWVPRRREFVEAAQGMMLGV